MTYPDPKLLLKEIDKVQATLKQLKAETKEIRPGQFLPKPVKQIANRLDSDCSLLVEDFDTYEFDLAEEINCREEAAA